MTADGPQRRHIGVSEAHRPAVRRCGTTSAGSWRAADEVETLDDVDPASGETAALVPLSGAAEVRDGGRGGAGGAARLARGAAAAAGAGGAGAARGPAGAARGAGRAGQRRHGQDPGRRRRRGRPRDRVGRVGGGDPAPAQGRDAGGRRRRGRRRAGAPAGRRGRRDHALQLPGDDPALVPALRDRLRQHLPAQALRAGPAPGGADRRDRRRGRGDPARRGQPRPRRSRRGDGDPRGPGHRRDLLRRPRRDRPDRRRRGGRAPASASRPWAAPRTRWW